jgi:hypothetical protein
MEVVSWRSLPCVHFSLDEDFFKHCKEFLRGQGFLLMADDLADDRIRRVEAQSLFGVVRSADITENVAPTIQWWAEQMPMFAAYSAAMASALNLYDPELARRVLGVIGKLENDELQCLFSGGMPPAPKGRYMIYLLQSRARTILIPQQGSMALE